MGAFYGCVDKMKLVVVTFVLALNLLVRCQAPETVIAQFRYLDYMNEEQRCNIAISLQSKITTCGSALQTPSQFIVGMGRELFIETNETRYGPDYPTGPGSASTSILSNLHQWSTDFGQGMGGISEYTLDGFGSNPDEIDVGNDDDWGLSPRDGSNVTDFTANGAYALYFEISTQFTFQLDISIFDNQERLLNFTLIPVSINSGNFIPYVVPYTFFEYANSSAGLGGFDLTHIGALDLGPTDSCANPTQGTQILNIFDDEPPTWASFPSNIEVPCSGSIPVQQPVPADNCNGVTGLTFNDTPSDADCPDLLVINRVWRVQDNCGTSTSRTQVITLTDDAFPIATAPASVTIPCSSSTDPSVLGTASFALGCPAYEDPSRVTITFSDQRSVNNCPTTILRTWTVTDACNQQDTDTQIITLTDTVPPTFDQSTLPPLTIEVQCGDPFPPVDIAFSDNCDPNPQLTATTGPPVELPAVGQCPEILELSEPGLLRIIVVNPKVIHKPSLLIT